MSSESRQRRDARRRAVGRAAPGTGGDDMVELISQAAWIADAVPKAAAPLVDQLVERSRSATDPARDPAALVVDLSLAAIVSAWERGWQPADLVHVAKRRASKPAARWMSVAVLAEAARSRAWDRAPEAWVGQLASLPGDRDATVDTLLPMKGRATVEQWIPVLAAFSLLRRLPASQRLVPPPSQWGQEPPPVRRSASPTRPSDRAARLLPRIRALLAKAESTDHPAEAEAFTAKAQELMTRHAIDEALLADVDAAVDVHAVRVLVHDPYAMQKVGLLDVIARANRSRVVWSSFSSCATLVGVPTDVQLVEMLFTSTLVQATRAMTQAGQGPDHRGPERTASFRKAFLTAYAIRIGERLTATAERTTAGYGTDLVPVLAHQEAAVGQEMDRLFPDVTTSSARTTSFDLRGWDAGTRAADAAVLPAGEVES